MNIDVRSALEAVVRRWYVMAIVLMLSVVVAVVLMKHTRQYVANSAVILTTQADAPAVTSNGTTGLVAAGLSIQPSDLPILIQSENVLSNVARDIGYDAPVGNMRRQIKAHVGLQTDIMPIEFSAKDPRQAVLGANAVADELTRYYQIIATSRFSKLIVDLQRQIAGKRAALAQLDADLQRTIAQDPDVAAKEPAVMSAQFAALQTQRDQLAAAAKGDAEIAAYGKQLTAATIPLAQREIDEADPAYRTLFAQYGKDSAELDRIRAAYSPTYPGLPELEEEVSREAQQVTSAQAQLARGVPYASQSYNGALKLQLQAMGQQYADAARIAAIDQQISSLRATVTARMSSSVRAASLRRERDSTDAALSSLQARLAEADADRAVAGSLGSIAVISRAEYADPATFSKPKVVLIATLAAAFWAGLALIVVLEQLDRRLRTRKQIEGVYGVPVVATVGASL